jgi:ribosomal protein L3 glutamine methyltransferase
MKSKADDAVDSLSSIRDFTRWGASRFTEASLFFGHGTDNALDEALFLVLNSLHLPYDLPADYFSSVLTQEERKRVTGMIERRISERKPAAYLTREALFAGLPFYVDERVLVPRSPIAELIKQRFEPWLEPGQVERVLDLCAGSGCIAIGCAYAFPSAEVDAVDISADALEVAEINVRKHDLADRVHLLRSDLFEQLGDQRYDLIVSNPPYVTGEELEELPDEYHFEPKVGLNGGESGLDCVHRILEGAAPHLTESGILIVEVGNSAETLQNLYPYVPFYWLEFEHGGDGVFLLTVEQVKVFHPDGG